MKKIVLHVDPTKLAAMQERSLLGFTLLTALLKGDKIPGKHTEMLNHHGVQIIAQEDVKHDGNTGSQPA